MVFKITSRRSVSSVKYCLRLQNKANHENPGWNVNVWVVNARNANTWAKLHSGRSVASLKG